MIPARQRTGHGRWICTRAGRRGGPRLHGRGLSGGHRGTGPRQAGAWPPRASPLWAAHRRWRSAMSPKPRMSPALSPAPRRWRRWRCDPQCRRQLPVAVSTGGFGRVRRALARARFWRLSAGTGSTAANAGTPGRHTHLHGATASLRGRAKFASFASFAAAKAALRMISQSLTREFGPNGIHVAHVIVDGAIDDDRIRASIANAADRFGEDGMLHPDRIAESYLMLHRQHRSAWTQELDLRPFSETF
jgi:NAD(P)-dependent dehydrogenase (short-subunit alcohol dehydrogenase family)